MVERQKTQESSFVRNIFENKGKNKEKTA